MNNEIRPIYHSVPAADYAAFEEAGERVWASRMDEPDPRDVALVNRMMGIEQPSVEPAPPQRRQGVEPTQY